MTAQPQGRRPVRHLDVGSGDRDQVAETQPIAAFFEVPGSEISSREPGAKPPTRWRAGSDDPALHADTSTVPP